MVRVQRIFIFVSGFVVGELVPIRLDLQTISVLATVGLAATILAVASVYYYQFEKYFKKKERDLKMGDNSVYISAKTASIRDVKRGYGRAV